MIPKIIHYIWLGNNPMPQEIRKCIESWKQHMPDYKLMLWDNEAIKDINMVFVNEAITAGKYAFASDIIRLWALEKYGGIYLDTDVKVLKSFDPLLSMHAFIGREECMQINYHTTSYHLTSYCFGAEQGNVYIKRCLSYYSDRHFITSPNKALPNDLRYDMRNASFIYCEMARLLGYNPSTLAPALQHCENDVLTILPPDVFASNGKTNDAYCIHLSFGSWRDKAPKQEKYTLRYKIEWRIRNIAERILEHFGYIMLKRN